MWNPFRRQRRNRGDKWKTDEYIQKRKNSCKYLECKNKIKEKLVSHYNHEIEKRVLTSFCGGEFVYPEFKNVRITDEALKKANYITRRTSELAGISLEVYLYLLDDREKQEKNDVLVKDVYITKKQEVEPSYCRATADGQIDSILELKASNKRIIGWGHSHGAYHPFHSSVDDKTLIEVLQDNSVSAKVNVLDDEKEELFFGVEYSPSIVFTNRNDNPYAAIGVRYRKLSTSNKNQRVFHINHRVNLQIVHEKKDIWFDKKKIDLEILNRLCFRGEPLGELYRRRTSDNSWKDEYLALESSKNLCFGSVVARPTEKLQELLKREPKQRSKEDIGEEIKSRVDGLKGIVENLIRENQELYKRVKDLYSYCDHLSKS
jgi:hypothetical protein